MENDKRESNCCDPSDSEKPNEANEVEPCCCGNSTNQNEEDNSSAQACCDPLPSSRKWSITKNIIFSFIIILAIVVAVHSFVRKRHLKETSASFCIKLESLNSLNKVAADKDFIFIILPDQNIKITDEVSKAIHNTSDKISKNGKRTEVYTLENGSPDYNRLASSLKIKNYPVVVSMAKDCGMEVVSGDITEEKLYNSYLKALKPRSACCPK